MTAFVALLRAVNVGGTGKLPMSDLRTLCQKAGFGQVQTYIASGNVVLTSDLAEHEVKSRLEASLATHAGKPVGVMVRTAAELDSILAANPFPEAPGNRAVVIFLDAPPPADALAAVTGKNDERLALGRREVYVHYGDGMADSRLRIPAAAAGTARNLNTVAKLAAMAKAKGLATPGSEPRAIRSKGITAGSQLVGSISQLVGSISHLQAPNSHLQAPKSELFRHLLHGWRPLPGPPGRHEPRLGGVPFARHLYDFRPLLTGSSGSP